MYINVRVLLCARSRDLGVNVSGLEGRILLCVVNLVTYCYGILFTFLCRRDLANSFKLNQVFIIILIQIYFAWKSFYANQSEVSLSTE